MALAHRKAKVVWEGGVGNGGGALQADGALAGAPVEWASTDSQAGDSTSPEQLLAAAEAACYAMTLALALERRDHPVERLEINAACELDRTSEHDPSEYRVTRVALDVSGRVPGLSAEEFDRLARHADEQCPISAALRGNVEVVLASVSNET